MAQTRDILSSPRVVEMKHKRRIKRVRLLVLIFILFISIIFGLSVLSQYKKINITNIVVAGTRIINTDEVKTLIESDMSGKYLHLFSKHNSFIYPKQYVYNDLLKTFPRIEKLTIYRGPLNTINAIIVERAGSYLWCGDSVPEIQNDIGENCYFINNDGYIFDKAPYFSGNVYFKFYIPLLNSPINPLGLQMLKSDDFHSLLRFVSKTTDLGLKPIYLVFDNIDTYQLYLDHGDNDTTPEIIFKNTDDLNKTADNLSIAMSKPEFADEIKSKYTTLLYIDLRFNNKVLYKFQ